MTSSDNIYLFVPNLIGYARIGLALWSFYLLPSDPLYAMSLYALSCLLDAVDGYAARSLNQSMLCIQIIHKKVLDLELY